MAKPVEGVGPQGGSTRSAVPTRLVVSGLIVVLALCFIFQNTASGRLRFLFWSFDAPAWAWIALIFASGLVVGSIFPWFRRRQP